jgi:sulfite exporter TauE/SafE
MSTYFLFGLLFGLIGQGISIAGYQQVFSIAIGILILLFYFFPSSIANRITGVKNIYGYVGSVKALLAKQFKKSSITSLFLIGTLNGLLPCGFVYLAIGGSITTGSSLEGGLFMAGFGLGTLPAMLLFSFAGDLFSLNVRAGIRKAVPVFVCVMACFLILRGMNLGIPYVSPKMEASVAGCVKHSCCHK